MTIGKTVIGLSETPKLRISYECSAVENVKTVNDPCRAVLREWSHELPAIVILTG